MRILLLDIETAPNVAYVWGLFDQNVSHDQVIESSYIICWSAQWYGEKKIMHEYVQDKHAPRKQMLLSVHHLLDQADIVVHYNGKKFDIPILNREFFKHQIHPPSPYKQVDLYKTVKKEMRFESNKMAALTQQLGLASKLAHDGFQMWVGCMDGDRDCLAKMTKYNKQDVHILDLLFPRFLPWLPNYPKMNIDHPEACPRCGAKESLQARGRTVTTTMTYRRYQCQSCGGWCRERLSEPGPKPMFV